jgi:hypothetical protein
VKSVSCGAPWLANHKRGYNLVANGITHVADLLTGVLSQLGRKRLLKSIFLVMGHPEKSIFSEILHGGPNPLSNEPVKYKSHVMPTFAADNLCDAKWDKPPSGNCVIGPLLELSPYFMRSWRCKPSEFRIIQIVEPLNLKKAAINPCRRCLEIWRMPIWSPWKLLCDLIIFFKYSIWVDISLSYFYLIFFHPWNGYPWSHGGPSGQNQSKTTPPFSYGKELS